MVFNVAKIASVCASLTKTLRVAGPLECCLMIDLDGCFMIYLEFCVVIWLECRSLMIPELPIKEVLCVYNEE